MSIFPMSFLSFLFKTTPVLVQELISREMVAVAAGAAHCVATDAQGQTLVWGRSDSGQVRFYTSSALLCHCRDV